MNPIALALAAVSLFPTTATAAPKGRVDHILLGVSDLDQGIASFEALTGVRPVYGGKHPTGTHNALVSLGDGLYLEIIAVQAGAQPPAGFESLAGLRALTPIGWAVSGPEAAALRGALVSVGLPVTEPRPGSRATPAGATLSWQSFSLLNEFEEAPFFITWSPNSPHPSTTSPSGCQLRQWRIAGPRHAALDRLREALGLMIETAEGPTASFRLSLVCPKGTVDFESAPKAK